MDRTLVGRIYSESEIKEKASLISTRMGISLEDAIIRLRVFNGQPDIKTYFLVSKFREDLRWKSNPLDLLRGIEDFWFDVFDFFGIENFGRFN